MEDVRLAKAVLVSEARSSRRRKGHLLALSSIGFASLARSPKFFIKLWVIETKISYSYITVFGLLLIPVLAYSLWHASGKVKELREAFMKDYKSSSNFDCALLSKPPSGFWKNVGIVYPYVLAIIATVTMMAQFYNADASYSREFLAYEKKFNDGAVAYEPWFSILYLTGFVLIILWTYCELAPRHQQSVAIDDESGDAQVEQKDSTQ